ncbi:MAG: CaCA family calcium (Ca2+):cation antiporter, partial [Parcubacteria group bacterium GW2011_GWF2_43_11]
MILQILILLSSFLLFALAGKWLIDALSRIGVCLKLKEFVLAFFIMGVGATLPNLIIGVTSALKKIPELSFGDVMGANIFDLSLVVGLVTLISRSGLSSSSRTIQGSSIFMMVIALLPIFLVLDGSLSRLDGIFLLAAFATYTCWLFSKKDRFTKVYKNCPLKFSTWEIVKDTFTITAGLLIIFIGGQGVVYSATFFYETFHLPLGLIGMFVVAIGTCMPETFFSLQAARKGQDWMILGNLMGNVIITSTFVLGIVSLIAPIKIVDFSPFAIARLFLIIAVLFFIFFVKTGHKIT